MERIVRLWPFYLIIMYWCGFIVGRYASFNYFLWVNIIIFSLWLALELYYREQRRGYEI